MVTSLSTGQQLHSVVNTPANSSVAIIESGRDKSMDDLKQRKDLMLVSCLRAEQDCTTLVCRESKDSHESKRRGYGLFENIIKGPRYAERLLMSSIHSNFEAYLVVRAPVTQTRSSVPLN